MSIWVQVIFGALVLGAGEGVYLILRKLRRQAKRSIGVPTTGAD